MSESLKNEKEKLINLNEAFIDILYALKYKIKKIRYEMLFNAFNFVQKYDFWYSKDQLFCINIEKTENDINEYIKQIKDSFSKFDI